MGYIITFCVGIMLGFIATAIITVGNSSEKITESYNRGFEDGRTSALNDSSV